MPSRERVMGACMTGTSQEDTAMQQDGAGVHLANLCRAALADWRYIMRLRLLVAAVLVAAIVGLPGPGASADRGSAAYLYGIGGPAAGPDFAFLAGPPVARADNG